MSTDDTMLDELLGAYALDAVDADEAVAVEAYLERTPQAAQEVARLRKAAAWIGATEALTPPPELHHSVLGAARARRSARTDDDPFLDFHVRADEAAIDARHAQDRPGGIRVPLDCAGRLATERVAAGSLCRVAVDHGVAPVGPLDRARRDRARHRTPHRIFVERFRDRPLQEVREVWRVGRRDPAVVRRRASRYERAGVRHHRESRLVARDTGVRDLDTHRRPSAGCSGDLEPPPPSTLRSHGRPVGHVDAAALEVAGRVRPGKTALIVLTGDGGGDWLIPLRVRRGGETPTSCSPPTSSTGAAASRSGWHPRPCPGRSRATRPSPTTSPPHRRPSPRCSRTLAAE